VKWEGEVPAIRGGLNRSMQHWPGELGQNATFQALWDYFQLPVIREQPRLYGRTAYCGSLSLSQRVVPKYGRVLLLTRDLVRNRWFSLRAFKLYRLSAGAEEGLRKCAKMRECAD
jgi:hypothetical protein